MFENIGDLEQCGQQLLYQRCSYEQVKELVFSTNTFIEKVMQFADLVRPRRKIPNALRRTDPARTPTARPRAPSASKCQRETPPRARQRGSRRGRAASCARAASARPVRLSSGYRFPGKTRVRSARRVRCSLGGRCVRRIPARRGEYSS